MRGLAWKGAASPCRASSTWPLIFGAQVLNAEADERSATKTQKKAQKTRTTKKRGPSQKKRTNGGPLLAQRLPEENARRWDLIGHIGGVCPADAGAGWTVSALHVGGVAVMRCRVQHNVAALLLLAGASTYKCGGASPRPSARSGVFVVRCPPALGTPTSR